MTSEEKISAIAARIRQCETSGKYEIECPYCGALNTGESEALCCEKFGMAVAAILHRWDTKEQIEKLDELMEAASRN